MPLLLLMYVYISVIRTLTTYALMQTDKRKKISCRVNVCMFSSGPIPSTAAIVWQRVSHEGGVCFESVACIFHLLLL